MRINAIKIQNFRGFKNKSFVFDSNMNVVLGNNTTGKTTLLHAIQIALGGYLQALTLIPKGKYFSKNFLKSDQVRIYSETTKSFLPDENKPSIEVNADFIEGILDIDANHYSENIKQIHWTRVGAKNSQKNAGELMDAVYRMEQQRRNADATRMNSVFPLLLSFGATRLQNNYNGAEKTKARASREEKAYKCALDEQVDFKSAFDWIYSYDKNILKELEFTGTDEAFYTAIKEAIPAIKQIYIDKKNNEFTAQIQMTGDLVPRWLTYDMMSDGFKSMINIVTEIAYRCIELNGFIGKDAVKKTPGIIMIDEVDLYLHPHWQKHILSDLQNAFPMLQFIVTTHSPFIVQSVDTRNIITLDSVPSQISPSNRGIEEIMVAEMGLNVDLGNRSEKYRKKYELAHKYYHLVKEGREATADLTAVRDELEKMEMEAHMFHDPAFEAALRLKRGDL